MIASCIRIIIILLFLHHVSMAQVDCRSHISGSLKPLYSNSPLSWAIEIAPAYGIMTDRRIFNGMSYLGIDFSKGKHQLYVEGGMKFWTNSLSETKHTNRRIGLREGFYRYYAGKHKISIGFQSMKLGDYYLLDERNLGVTHNFKNNAFDIKFSGGTVIKDWARMGSYCSVKYLYNVIRGDVDQPLGEKLGETNFTGLVLTWTPSDKPTNQDSKNDEFSSVSSEFETVQPAKKDSSQEFNSAPGDEFSSAGTDFSDNIQHTAPKKTIFHFYQAGVVAYSEFGSAFGSTRIYTGPFLTFNLPLGIDLQIEALYQQNETSTSIGQFSKLRREFLWKKSGTTLIETYWVGNSMVTGNDKFGPAFSNLFMGEVVRLEAFDAPMFVAMIKHTFPWKKKYYIKVKFIRQLENWKVTSCDFETGIRLFKPLRLTGIFSYIDSDFIVTGKPMFLSRLEARFTF